MHMLAGSNVLVSREDLIPHPYLYQQYRHLLPCSGKHGIHCPTQKLLKKCCCPPILLWAFTCTGYLLTMRGSLFIAIHGEQRNRAGQGLARTKGLIAISPCRSLHAKLVFLAICRLRVVVQEPAHTVLPLSSTVVLYHTFGAMWCNRHYLCKSPQGTLRRIHGVECGQFKGAIKLPRLLVVAGTL